MKRLFIPLINFLQGKNPGVVGAVSGLSLGLLLVIFGFWKTLLVLFLMVMGYILGVKYFSNPEQFKQLLDRLLPPGRFR